MYSKPPRRMESHRHKKTISGLAALSLLATLTFAAPYISAGKDKKHKNKSSESAKAMKGLPIQDLSEEEAILQALNRLGFGPRPGDIDRVKEMGLQKWIDQQLHPESIDDSALDARVDRFPTLKMSSTKLLEEFPQPQVAAKREGITVEEYRKEQQDRVRQAMAASGDGGDMNIMDTQIQSKFEKVDSDPNADMGKGQGKGQG